MKKDKEILIVGAGPSGLSMAIFLNELGYRPKIIDKKSEISQHSKALGVNPRTLEIFQPYGITEKFLSNGRKMTAMNIWKGDKHIYRNDFSRVAAKYPFMLIQPQKESEEILLEEVVRRKLDIQYERELLGWDTKAGRYEAKFRNAAPLKNLDYIIGADGGSSQVRKQLGIEYKGFRYDEIWELYDIELEMEVDPDEGHIRLFPDGGMVMIRLKENIWRIAGSVKSILNYLPSGAKTGQVHWKSEFRIHHKVAQSLSADKVVLLGDAAHLHSPIGARGMNLGIEDAFLSSQLLDKNRLADFDKSRRPYLEKTVKIINNITNGMATTSVPQKLVRSNIGSLRFLFPFVMPRVRNFVLGLS